MTNVTSINDYKPKCTVELSNTTIDILLEDINNLANQKTSISDVEDRDTVAAGLAAICMAHFNSCY